MLPCPSLLTTLPFSSAPQGLRSDDRRECGEEGAGSRVPRSERPRRQGASGTSGGMNGVGGREASRVARHAGGGDQAEGRVEHRGRRQTEDDGDTERMGGERDRNDNMISGSKFQDS